MLNADSTEEEIHARRDEIALEQAKLTKEHRALGKILKAKQADVVEIGDGGNVIEVSDMEVESNG